MYIWQLYIINVIKLVKTACKYIIVVRLVFCRVNVACVLSRSKRGLAFRQLRPLGLLYNVVLYKIYHVNIL